MATHWTAIEGGGGVHASPYVFNDLTINTTAVELGDGRLLVVGPGTATSDEAFAELDALGTVAAIASPGPFHHMGMPKWQARYPDAKLFATASGLTRIPKQHKKVSLSLEPISTLTAMLPKHVTALETAGTKHADLHLVVHGDGDTCTWVTNEIITNNASYPPSFMFRTMFKLFGVHPGLAVNMLALKLIGGKKKPLGDFFRAQLDAAPPTHLLPSHGDILAASDLPAQLRTILDQKLA